MYYPNDDRSPPRYLLFVGNMPYDVTDKTLLELFSKVGEVKEVRMRKDRGFAFVEMADAVGHGKALRLHHTQMGARRINVEVTVGGGGNSAKRQTKLKAKKTKFDRLHSKRRARSEAEAKKAAEAKEQAAAAPATA